MFEASSGDPNPMYKNAKVTQTGGEMIYTLVSVEGQGKDRLAEISLSCSGEVTMTSDRTPIGGGKSVDKVTEKGTIWLDLASGWLVKGEITRRVEANWDGRTRIDETKTIAERKGP